MGYPNTPYQITSPTFGMQSPFPPTPTYVPTYNQPGNPLAMPMTPVFPQQQPLTFEPPAQEPARPSVVRDEDWATNSDEFPTLTPKTAAPRVNPNTQTTAKAQAQQTPLPATSKAKTHPPAATTPTQNPTNNSNVVAVQTPN